MATDPKRPLRRLALLLGVLAVLAVAPALALGGDAPADTADTAGDAPTGIAGAAAKLHLCFGTVGAASVAAWVLVWVVLLVWALRTPRAMVFLIGCFLVALVVVYGLTAPRVGKVLTVLAWGPLAAALAVVIASAWRRRRLPLAFAMFLLAMAAFGLGMWNSANVGEIVEDRSAELAAARQRQVVAQQRQAAAQLAARRAAHEAEVARLKARAADVHFAEDAPGDAADAAGYKQDELNKLDAPPPADYEYRKRGKQQRDPSQVDTSASALDTIVAEDDEDVSAGARKLATPDFLLAHQLDRVNRFAVWLTLVAAALLAAVEYLRRFNRTVVGVLPLPVACRAIDAIWPKTHTAMLPASGDGADTARDYADTVVRKREAFILIAPADPWPNRSALPRLPLLPKLWPLPKITAPVGDPACDIRLVFESAWYGRYGFVLLAESLDGPLRTALDELIEMLRMRHHTRAAARRTVHLLWAIPDVPPADRLAELALLCRETNVKFVAIAPDPAPWPPDAFEEICPA